MLERAEKISAVIISLNEELDIARALDSVSWCDEILVVDSGSYDRTVEICQQRGCKVISRKFAGYGEQKSFAVTQAAHDWILAIDADEEVSVELRNEILEKLKSPGDTRGYYLPINTVLWDGVVRLDPRHTKDKLRLFDRRYGNFDPQLVHESVMLEGRTERLKQLMYNFSYRNIADYFEKFNQYTTAAALQAYQQGKTSHYLAALVQIPISFLQICFLKGFIRDGSIGVTWSLFSALYPAVKQFKLLEICRVYPRPAAQNASLLKHAPLAAQRSVETAGRGKWFRSRATRYPFALLTVALTLGLILALRQDQPVDDFMLLFAAVLAVARFWGFGPALAATSFALLGLDYLVLMPANLFVLPDMDGFIQLSLFAGLSLLTSSLLFTRKRRASR